MATTAQTDDELIILEDDTSTEVSEIKPESKLSKLSLGGLMGKKETTTADSLIVEETPVVEDSKAIADLGESLETTNEASDLFKENVLSEQVDETVDLFGETESAEATEQPVAAMFGESELEKDLAVESEISLVEEVSSTEAEVDLFTESETAENSKVEEVAEKIEVTEAQEDISLVSDIVEEKAIIEDESSIFGGDDSSAQDDSVATDEQSMDQILAGTIAKLESRKALIIADKEADKAQIADRKAQIKELETEIAEFEGTIKELGNEQRSITNNVKSLEKMKLSAQEKTA